MNLDYFGKGDLFMAKCPQCGNESFFEESGTVVRCNSCFTKVSFEEIDRQLISPTPVKRQTQLNFPKNTQLIRYAISLSAILFSLLFSFYSYRGFKEPSSITNSVSVPPSPIQEKNPDSGPLSNQFSIEELTPIPDSIGNIYFVGYIVNEGTESVEKPRVDMQFFDKNNKLVASTFGYAVSSMLAANERSMIQILLKDAPKFERFETEIKVTPLYYQRENPKMEILNLEIVQGTYGKKIKGKLKNTNDYPVQFIEITMILRDKDKKIIHFYNRYLPEKNLGAGKEANFDLELFIRDLNYASHEVSVQAMKI